ncbi:MAG: nucleoside hydrolase [Mycobacterium sp.]
MRQTPSESNTVVTTSAGRAAWPQLTPSRRTKGENPLARKIILDVDTGSDDAVAIMMAALAPAIDLVACTTVWGNLGLDSTTDNTLRVLEYVGCGEVPVHRGLSRPFAPTAFPPNPGEDRNRTKLHAERVPLPAARRSALATPAVEWLVEYLRTAAQPVTLVSVAPLTNIAAAITVDPRIVGAVEEVVLMGGGHAIGNSTASAEANIWHDPVSADVVFQAGFERLTVVPLDATHEAYLTLDDVATLRAAGPPASAAAGFIEHMISGYAEMQPMEPRDSSPLHDALCIAYLLDAAVLELQSCYAAIETTGRHTYGRTVFDLRHRSLREHNVHVAMHADRERFVRILHDALIDGAGSNSLQCL